MGTNYYWHETPPCSACGHAPDPLHIGKSSCGWVFALHIHPEKGIEDLPDWVMRFIAVSKHITDEYGRIITPAEMLGTIMLRGPHKSAQDDSWYALNHAIRGPHGLARARDAHKRGQGTWDCHIGDFS